MGDVPLSGDLHSAFEDPAFTASCLHALRRSLDCARSPAPDEAELRAWRERWFREAGFFHTEFASLRSEAQSDTSLLGRAEDLNGGRRHRGVENGLGNEMPDTNGKIGCFGYIIILSVLCLAIELCRVKIVFLRDSCKNAPLTQTT